MEEDYSSLLQLLLLAALILVPSILRWSRRKREQTGRMPNANAPSREAELREEDDAFPRRSERPAFEMQPVWTPEVFSDGELHAESIDRLASDMDHSLEAMEPTGQTEHKTEEAPATDAAFDLRQAVIYSEILKTKFDN